jgi:DNA repair exonuclease SbcCD ATPase subunit
VKTVSLDYVILTRFRSFRKKVRIDLSGAPGLVLFAGDNRVEPRLGANGAGKSSVWDGIEWCFHGQSVRGLKVGDLVSHGEKSTEVEVGLRVDGEPRVVFRKGPPGHVFLDGRTAEHRVEQEVIDALLGLNRARFLSSVIFGQAVPLFVDRSIPERGELLDDVLGLGVWLRASEVAGKKLASATSELNSLKVDIGRTEGAFGALESADDLLARVQDWDDVRAERRKVAKAEIEEAEGVAAVLSIERDRLAVRGAPDDTEARELVRQAQRREATARAEIAVAAAEERRLRADLAEFDESDVCPTCGQSIATADPAARERHRADVERALSETVGGLETLRDRLAKIEGVVERRRAAWEKVRDERVEHEVTAGKLDAKVEAAERDVRSAHALYARVEAEANPYAERREAVRVQRRSLREKLRDQRKAEEDLASRIARLDYWRQGFKRVRLFCMGRAMDQLGLDTMNAAHSLGLVGWKIAFVTETETKSGTTKTGVQISVASPAGEARFDAWSGGEGQRIRLCISFGLASLIQRWSGVRYDFEVLDEPTAWLSEAGIEDLLELLKERADMHGRRIFLADHRGLQHAGIDRVITIAKGPDGSFVA